MNNWIDTLKRFFGIEIDKTSLNKKLQNISDEILPTFNNIIEANKIVKDYGAFIAKGNHPTGACCVADSNKLPYSKQKIKEAIFTCFQLEKDPQMRENMKCCIIMLADFQDGVGKSNIGFDVIKYADTDQQLQDREEILRQMKLYKKWEPIIEEELYRLMLDMDELEKKTEMENERSNKSAEFIRKKIFISKDSKNIMETPSENSKVVGKIVKGDKIFISSNNHDGWYTVSSNNIYGWMKHDNKNLC